MTESPMRKPELPRNTFEAWNANFYESKATTTNAWALAYALLGFWNMNGKGRCNPSMETLLAKTRIKSENTLRKAIQELEDIGEWAVVRSKGRSSHYYYPMFVKNARTDLLNRDRSEEDAICNELAESDLEPQFPESEAVYSYDEKLGYEEKDDSHSWDGKASYSKSAGEASYHPEILQQPLLETTGLPTSPAHENRDSSVRIKTPADLAIKEAYDSLMEEAAEQDPRKIVDYSKCTMHLVLSKGDTKDFNMTYDRFDDHNANPNKHYVVGGQGFVLPEELGPRWVEQFTLNYGANVFSYSSINEIYNYFFEEYGDRADWDAQMRAVDTAMYVLGNDGFVPSIPVVKALMFGTKHNDKMKRLKEQLDETKIGRELTSDYIARGIYPTKGKW